MKKILGFIFGVFAFLEFCFFSFGATTYQPTNLGYVNLAISTMSLTLVAQTTAPVGSLVYCTNCATNGGVGTICVSTESTTAQNAFVLSTGTVCK